jgi:hypothetical protein
MAQGLRHATNVFESDMIASFEQCKMLHVGVLVATIALALLYVVMLFR